MNQFSYEIATTTWMQEHVLLVIDYKVRTINIHGEGLEVWFGLFRMMFAFPKL